MILIIMAYGWIIDQKWVRLFLAGGSSSYRKSAFRKCAQGDFFHDLKFYPISNLRVFGSPK